MRRGSPARLVWIGVALATVAWSADARADRADARRLVGEGRVLADEGKQDAALQKLEAAIAADDDYLAAYETALPLYFAAKRYRDVVTHMIRVTLRHPSYAEGWYALGYAYRRLGKARLAVASYEVYLPLRPRDPSPYFGIGMALKQLGERDRAAAAFARYLRLEHDPARASYVATARRELRALDGTDDLARLRDAATAVWSRVGKLSIRLPSMVGALAPRGR